MAPFRVTFELGTEVAVPNRLIHLDDLLAWAAVDKAGPTHPGDEPFAAKEHLPLERFETGTGWCWRASALRFKVMSEPRLLCRTSRTDYTEIARLRDKTLVTGKNVFKAGEGRYKGFDIRDVVQWVDSAEAWGVGQIEEVKDLLGRITAIGKLRKIGFGRVRAFHVEPVENADAWRYRHLPEPYQNHIPAIGGLRSPYWDRTRHQKIFAPITEVNHHV